MKRCFWIFGLAFALISCGGNNKELTKEEKEKIKQAKLDSIAEARFNEINQDDVDTFPIFTGICADSLPKEEQKKCFETSFVKLLHGKLQKEKFEATAPINDKILVNIKVDNSGKITLVNIETPNETVEMPATAKQSFQEIITTHLESISNENPIMPATKQGLEVGTQFTLPIVINVK